MTEYWVAEGAPINIIEGEWTVLLTIEENGLSYRREVHKRLKAREMWTDILAKQDIGTFFMVERKALMRAKVEMITTPEDMLFKPDVPPRGPRLRWNRPQLGVWHSHGITS